MKLQTLGALLQEAGLGVVGTSIFYHNMPDATEAILFREPLDGIRIDHELPGRYRHALQVIVRGTGMGPVKAKCDLVAAALTMGEREIAGMSVTFIRLSRLPILYPRSEKGGAVEGSINFDCCYVLT